MYNFQNCVGHVILSRVAAVGMLSSRCSSSGGAVGVMAVTERHYYEVLEQGSSGGHDGAR